eukprot:700665-Amphidinium_carterae.1
MDPIGLPPEPPRLPATYRTVTTLPLYQEPDPLAALGNGVLVLHSDLAKTSSVCRNGWLWCSPAKPMRLACFVVLPDEVSTDRIVQAGTTFSVEEQLRAFTALGGSFMYYGK